MALQSIPIRRVGTRENLLLGADRELLLFSAMISALMIFAALKLSSIVIGSILWIASVYLLRMMGKADPRMRTVYLRHRRYAGYYPARSTPFHQNMRPYR
jgi:type IV secretion system protein VirB3